jgi:3-oxoacyl-[acyl-carrier protein] reductase
MPNPPSQRRVHIPRALRKLAGPLRAPPELERGRWDAVPTDLQDRRVILVNASFEPPSEALIDALRAQGATLETATPETGCARDDGSGRQGLVFDARAMSSLESLHGLVQEIGPLTSRLDGHARIVILGLAERYCSQESSAEVQAAMTGFARSLARESGRFGTTVQLLRTDCEGGEALHDAVAFFLSPQSAYVTGQVIEVDAESGMEPASPQSARSVEGRTVLVTGAARGIGHAVAERMAAAGARVVGVDLDSTPPLRGSRQVYCDWLALDLSRKGATDALVDRIGELGGCDTVVHSAGMLRDRTFARMKPEEWREVIDVNLMAPTRINRALLAADLVRPEGSLVCLSSIAGIAGNVGQTNYAAAKAGLIGHVRALARELESSSIRANAIAPGFIETGLTRSMPWLIRSVARRMNALGQAGLPSDVAALALFLAGPAGRGINGQVLRVCGGSIMGA